VLAVSSLFFPVTFFGRSFSRSDVRSKVVMSYVYRL